MEIYGQEVSASHVGPCRGEDRYIMGSTQFKFTDLDAQLLMENIRLMVEQGLLSGRIHTSGTAADPVEIKVIIPCGCEWVNGNPVTPRPYIQVDWIADAE